MWHYNGLYAVTCGMNSDEQLLLVRRSDFLAKLTDEEYESLQIAHNVVTATRNSYIYLDDSQHNKLFFIKEGYVKLGRIDDHGNETIHDILAPGDIFGQITLERAPRNGEFARAYRTNVALCAFTTGSFAQLLATRPYLAVDYTKKVGQQLRRVQNRLTNLLHKDVRSRVLYFLWHLLQQHPTSAGAAITIPNYLTHEDIARLTGTTRQTVTSLLSALAAEGIIEVNRNDILFKNIATLQKELKIT